jgi:hypothetical protein
MMGMVHSNNVRRVVFPIVSAVIIFVIAVIAAGRLEVKPLYAANPPRVPENLTAIAISSTQIYLRWLDRSDNEINFVIERKTGRSSYFPLNIVGSNITSYADTGLNPDAVYYYRIKAHGSAGDSVYSNEVSVAVLSSPVPSPVLLSPANASIVNTLIPQVKWVPAEEKVTYILEIATDRDFSEVVISKAGLTEANFTVPLSVLKWYSSYYWRVKTQNESNIASDWSSSWYFKLFPRSLGVHYCNCH